MCYYFLNSTPRLLKIISFAECLLQLAYVQRTTGGYVFSLFVHPEGHTPLSCQGGNPPCPLPCSLDWLGVPPPQTGQGVAPTHPDRLRRGWYASCGNTGGLSSFNYFLRKKLIGVFLSTEIDWCFSFDRDTKPRCYAGIMTLLHFKRCYCWDIRTEWSPDYLQKNWWEVCRQLSDYRKTSGSRSLYWA